MFGKNCSALGEAVFKVLNLGTNWTVRKTDSRPYLGQLVGNCSGTVRSFQT